MFVHLKKKSLSNVKFENQKFVQTKLFQFEFKFKSFSDISWFGRLIWKLLWYHKYPVTQVSRWERIPRDRQVKHRGVKYAICVGVAEKTVNIYDFNNQTLSVTRSVHQLSGKYREEEVINKLLQFQRFLKAT